MRDAYFKPWRRLDGIRAQQNYRSTFDCFRADRKVVHVKQRAWTETSLSGRATKGGQIANFYPVGNPAMCMSTLVLVTPAQYLGASALVHSKPTLYRAVDHHAKLAWPRRSVLGSLGPVQPPSTRIPVFLFDLHHHLREICHISRSNAKRQIAEC